MKHKKYSMTITEEERNWFHKLAKAEKKSIAIMIIHCLRRRSNQLGIPLPQITIPDNKRKYRMDVQGIILNREIKEENFQMNFI